MDIQNKLFDLEGRVQPYQWGGYTFIPALLSLEENTGKPAAEYWLGAHTQAPSIVNGATPLDQLIQQHPQLLGQEVRTRFGRLPYLLKVLDVKDMLSIQVHPSRENARKGFAAENEAGISITASNRNYKDDNHKPELAYALSEFWLLHGFRSIALMKETLAARKELCFLLPVFGEGDYANLYRTVMEMPEAEVVQHLQPLLDRILPLYEAGDLPKSNPDFWAARAAKTYNEPGRIDRGIFSIYLLNLVKMKKGQAIFQDAGLLHAYLEGQNVEIMANSDNVLRGGLTPKHVDVPELLKHVQFQECIPNLLDGTPVQPHEKAFLTPADDFELHQIELAEGEGLKLTASTVEILLVLEGTLELTEQDSGFVHTCGKGQSVLLTAGGEIEIRALGYSQAFLATVPAATK
ncbi:mannose-6-phosphate isomerase, class I [Flavihumibacter sp. CACIAM 22H1]|uniref:mannose-6-phosphate isomerase, class I n=1 Tax=Flavihumibacter sp. CACIAM 22H1 TaxID=1812911 RepID=UPI0007A8090F|nr:mannose-6-phosphate isomerase, class I [Flavihumibacter sp. CACIAM 22H1]KYP15093.1 MAG: mannose-6-phosphate isomerase [Flavihumibacter sp. CACIAM 22H1]